MGRNVRALLTASLALLLFFTARIFGKKPLPPPHVPFKERVTFLQKLFFGLQNVQNRTGRNADGQAGTSCALDEPILSFDAQREAPPTANLRFAKDVVRRKRSEKKSPRTLQAA